MADPRSTTRAAPALPHGTISDDPDRVLSFEEMLEFLHIGERLGWELCNRGELPGFRLGRLWRFRRSALVAYVKEQEKKGGRR